MISNEEVYIASLVIDRFVRFQFMASPNICSDSSGMLSAAKGYQIRAMLKKPNPSPRDRSHNCPTSNPTFADKLSKCI